MTQISQLPAFHLSVPLHCASIPRASPCFLQWHLGKSMCFFRLVLYLQSCSEVQYCVHMHYKVLVFYCLYFSMGLFFFPLFFFFSPKPTSLGPVLPVILRIHSRKQLLSWTDYALKSHGRQRKYYHHFVNKEPRHREIKWFTQGHPEHPVKAKSWTHVSWVSIKWFNYEIKDLLCIPDISPLRHGNKTFFRLGSMPHMVQ